MRAIDADRLIDDLKHDVAIDQDLLDYEELTDSNREKIQFDKDCKQNAIDFLQNAPTIPSAQPEPEIHWGYTPTYERPLADREIVPRLRDIHKQVGGSYAIDRAIEIIEAVAERITDELGDS